MTASDNFQILSYAPAAYTVDLIFNEDIRFLFGGRKDSKGKASGCPPASGTMKQLKILTGFLTGTELVE